MATDFYQGQGDRLPALTTTFEDETGPINLTGYTVTMNARKAGTNTVISGSASLADQTTSPGGVSYAWGASDTQLPGRWYVQWKATTGGKPVTVPNRGTDELWVNNFWAGVQ